MKSDDDSNTLERFCEEPNEPIESSEPTEPSEGTESIDEKTDYSSGLYETILSWEQHSGLQLVHSVFHDMIPIRSVRDRESGSVRPPKHELESFQHWTDKEFYDKKFGFDKESLEPHKINREKFDISPRDVFITAYLDEYKDVSRVERILLAISTKLKFFGGAYEQKIKGIERIVEKRIDQPYIQNRFGFSLASQEIIRQAVLKTDPNWKEGDEGFVLGEDGIPCPYTINMSNLPDDETEKEFRQSIIRWFGRGEQIADNFQIPPEMSDPPSKVIDPMLDIYHYSIEKGKFNDACDVFDWARDQISQHYDYDPEFRKSVFNKKTEDFIEGVKKLANNLIDELVDPSKSFNSDFEDKRKK